MIGLLIAIMGFSSMGQMSLEDHLLADILYSMGNNEQYNYWCNGVRCDEENHGGYTGIPEDCTTESEEDGTCGFGLTPPQP